MRLSVPPYKHRCYAPEEGCLLLDEHYLLQGVQKAGEEDDSLYNHPMTGNDKWDAIQEGGGICKQLGGKVPP